MKKIIAILMLALLIIPMTGCKSGKNEPLQQKVEELEENAAKTQDKEGK